MKISSLFEKITYNWPVKILCICAAVVLSFFYGLSKNEQRYITVPLNLLLNENLTTKNIQTQTVRVILTGREEDIFHIREDSIYVYADFSNTNKEGEYKAAISHNFNDLTYEGMDIEVEIEPETITVELESKYTRNVEIESVITGYPKLGYDLIDFKTKPEMLEIVGPRSTIENIEKIKTANIDISGLDNDFNYRVPLIMPPGNITVSSGRFIEVSGKIGLTMIAKTFDNIEIVFVNLADGLIIEDTAVTGNIKVRGTQLDMEKLGMNDFSLLVDCSAVKTSGKYTLNVLSALPLNVEKVSVDPEKITFIVSKKNDDKSTTSRER